MIKPHKFLDLDNCVISLSALILRILKENKIMKYDELYNIIYKNKGEKIKYSFIFALDFLFLLGKLQYYADNDTLELIE